MTIATQYRLRGRTAADIASSAERAIAEGRLPAGAVLPPVRSLAADLGVSPGTVAAAYRALAARGLVRGEGRRGTRVRPAPPLATPGGLALPPGVVDLADGNPDPALLPPLAPALARAGRRQRLYGEPAAGAELVERVVAGLAADGVPADRVAVVGGALDGLERVLQAATRPGDAVAVEDPGYPGVHDLVAALGLAAVPVAVDDAGPLPDDLDRALAGGAAVAVVTPRAGNPTGAAVDAERRRDLRRVLRRHPDALVVEDDHAGPVAGADLLPLADGRRPRWAVLRSVSKSLGPDLRLAVVAGDATTVARVEGRQRLGAGWVSHVLQDTVAALLADPATEARLERAASTYAGRRAALVAALARHGIAATGRSGLNVWVPVPAEEPVVAGLLARGWAVAAGARFRLRSGPAVRVTVARLRRADALRLAADLAATVAPAAVTRLA
ncbi:MAG TPA: aminotransferase class I/II-fold pyridoxal phosphate-dependent enzyme [Acidimicrobiales bacterium]